MTRAVAQRKCAPIYMSRGQQHKFHALIAKEEEEWELEQQGKESAKMERVSPHVQSFEEYRERIGGFS